jgi:hypothetical protein
MMKSRRMTSEIHVARMGQMKNDIKFCLASVEGRDYPEDRICLSRIVMFKRILENVGVP